MQVAHLEQAANRVRPPSDQWAQPPPAHRQVGYPQPRVERVLDGLAEKEHPAISTAMTMPAGTMAHQAPELIAVR